MASTTADVRTEDAAVSDLCAKIDAYVGLGPNWDGAEAQPISEAVAARAKALLGRTAQEARSRGLAWLEPSIAPNADGGVDLSWELDGHWTMLSVSPAHPRIECASQQGSSAPGYVELPLGEAVET